MSELNELIDDLNAARLVFTAALQDFDKLLNRLLKNFKAPTSFPLATTENELENVLYAVKEHLGGGEELLMALRLLDYLRNFKPALFDELAPADVDALDIVLNAFRRFDKAAIAFKTWTLDSKKQREEEAQA